MAYRIAGTYVLHCSCALLCPCAIDGQPTSPDGKCDASSVFHVENGESDGTDLSNVDFALYFHVPSNLSAGNWGIEMIVDESASDEQAQAIERIISGQEGGPFEEFVPLIGEVKPMRRGAVSFSDGDSPSASVAGETEIRFEPSRAEDGSPTTVSNAPLAFAPTVMIGRGSGKGESIRGSYEPIYGEAAAFEYAS
ncbi:MAG TPA: DUF1326 domain-containing protein [Actinomycetota bacterium]|jgi:hypothetical protein|nr:DUF1326 domain-containing protein [Actinomycetota bacterium]